MSDIELRKIETADSISGFSSPKDHVITWVEEDASGNPVMKYKNSKGEVFVFSSGTGSSGGTASVPSDARITLTQGGVSKGSFTLNQPDDLTVSLDAGSGIAGDFSISVLDKLPSSPDPSNAGMVFLCLENGNFYRGSETGEMVLINRNCLCSNPVPDPNRPNRRRWTYKRRDYYASTVTFIPEVRLGDGTIVPTGDVGLPVKIVKTYQDFVDFNDFGLTDDGLENYKLNYKPEPFKSFVTDIQREYPIGSGGMYRVEGDVVVDLPHAHYLCGQEAHYDFDPSPGMASMGVPFMPPDEIDFREVNPQTVVVAYQAVTTALTINNEFYTGDSLDRTDVGTDNTRRCGILKSWEAVSEYNSDTDAWEERMNWISYRDALLKPGRYKLFPFHYSDYPSVDNEFFEFFVEGKEAGTVKSFTFKHLRPKPEAPTYPILFNAYIRGPEMSPELLDVTVSIDGNPFEIKGTEEGTEINLAPGFHVVEIPDLEGYVGSGRETIQVDSTGHLDGTYNRPVEINYSPINLYGYLTVNADILKGSWSIGEHHYAWGETARVPLSPKDGMDFSQMQETVTVSYDAVNGFDTPKSNVITINGEDPLTLNVSYKKRPCSVMVNLSGPSDTSLCLWGVDDSSPVNHTGERVELMTGRHVITYKYKGDGWCAPPDRFIYFYPNSDGKLVIDEKFIQGCKIKTNLVIESKLTGETLAADTEFSQEPISVVKEGKSTTYILTPGTDYRISWDVSSLEGYLRKGDYGENCYYYVDSISGTAKAGESLEVVRELKLKRTISKTVIGKLVDVSKYPRKLSIFGPYHKKTEHPVYVIGSADAVSPKLDGADNIINRQDYDSDNFYLAEYTYYNQVICARYSTGSREWERSNSLILMNHLNGFYGNELYVSPHNGISLWLVVGKDGKAKGTMVETHNDYVVVTPEGNVEFGSEYW